MPVLRLWTVPAIFPAVNKADFCKCFKRRSVQVLQPGKGKDRPEQFQALKAHNDKDIPEKQLPAFRMFLPVSVTVCIFVMVWRFIRTVLKIIPFSPCFLGGSGFLKKERDVIKVWKTENGLPAALSGIENQTAVDNRCQSVSAAAILERMPDKLKNLQITMERQNGPDRTGTVQDLCRY